MAVGVPGPRLLVGLAEAATLNRRWTELCERLAAAPPEPAAPGPRPDHYERLIEHLMRGVRSPSPGPRS